MKLLFQANVPAKHTGQLPLAIEKLQRMLGSEYIEKLPLLRRVLGHEVEVFEKSILTNCLGAALPPDKLELGDSQVRFKVELAASIPSPERDVLNNLIWVQQAWQTGKNTERVHDDINLACHTFHDRRSGQGIFAPNVSIEAAQDWAVSPFTDASTLANLAVRSAPENACNSLAARNRSMVQSSRESNV